MKLYNFVLIFWCVIENSILRTEAANLFDAVGSVIGLGNNENGNLNLLPIGNNNNQFNNNQRNNLNYRPNNNQYKPFNNNGFNNGLNNNNNFNRPINNNNKLPNTNNLEPFRNQEELAGLSEDEKKAAQQYPGIANLLAKLKELNRQKELQKQKENGQNVNNGNGGNNTNNNGSNINNNGNNNIDNNNEVASNGWKVLRKRKFVFQAKPVRPDNEIVQDTEKVYYLD